MAHPFEVEIVAADRRLYSGQAESLVIPGTDGYFGVLSGHAPLVSALAVGELIIKPPGKPAMLMAVAGGFAEVLPDHVVILADAAELAEEIDIERARQARERAEERLRERGGGEMDIDRAQAALMRAINRLRVASQPFGGNM